MADGTVDYGKHEFRVRRTVLAQLVAQAAVAVPSREQLLVHGCFQVTVAPGWLQLAATDSQLTVLAGTQAVGADSSAVLYLPAQRLKSIIDAAPDGDVAVSVSGNLATITAGGPHWDVKMPPSRGYSELIDPAQVTFSVARRAALLDGLKAVRHAVSKDASRPQYAQVKIAKDGDRVFAVAYDGSRYCQAPVGAFPFETLVPAALLGDLLKLLERSPAEEVEVGAAGNAVAVRTGHTVLACTQMGAEFPDVARLVLDPTGAYGTELTVDRAELVRAVKRVAINAHPTTSAIALIADDGTLTVQTRDDTGNKAEEVIQAGWPGEQRLLVVNHQFLAAAAAAHPDASCVFRLGEDKGRRRSMLRLEDPATGVISVLPQMAPSMVGL